MRKNLLPIICLTLLSSRAIAFEGSREGLVLMEDKVFDRLNLKINQKSLERHDGSLLFSLDESFLPALSQKIHQEMRNCGGHFYFNDRKELEEFTALKEEAPEFLKSHQDDFPGEALVQEMLPKVDDLEITKTIQKLSSLKNRYYKAPTGVEGSDIVYNLWKGLTQHRSDVTIEKFAHTAWPQNSIILTIKGSDSSGEAVVLGGHLDSIIQTFMPGNNMNAPGADDNASGIATLTEIVRVLMLHNYRPQKDLVFMGYAAEEVGLRGSREIAQKWKKENRKVLGVIQFDMTNFKGSDQNIVFMTDYTHAGLNQRLGQLIDHYVQVSWGTSKCGYACSDHASWTAMGYPASIPHEAKMESSNKAIHTPKDTLERSNNHSKHAVNFAKLGLAYVVDTAH